MARLNVDELLTDPDLVDPIILVRRTSTVDNLGRNQIAETQIKTIGSVQPAQGKIVSRLPESLRVANIRSFWIKANITASAPGAYSDILIFGGQRFQVQTVMDWSNFGEGYSEGTCVAEVPA